jgi:hypothetical protein
MHVHEHENYCFEREAFGGLANQDVGVLTCVSKSGAFTEQVRFSLVPQ